MVSISTSEAKAVAGRPDVEADLARLWGVLSNGGISIHRSGLGYGIFGTTLDAVKRINAAKKRGEHKRQGMLMNAEMSEDIQIIDPDKRAMIDCIVHDYDLPCGVIASYREDHPHMKSIDPELLELCTARGTVACALNTGGPFNARMAILSRGEGIPVFGSSANISGRGQRYRVADIEPELLEIADIVLDYGIPEYHQYKAAASLINFDTLEVVRFGACYELIADVLHRHFGLILPSDPGRDNNPTGHLNEFALQRPWSGPWAKGS
jgi:tRNA A37 threonylcarbamoyladenosine synthetase subunit TsaC/SUA5/YrdC